MFAIDGVKLPSNASKAKSGTRADYQRQAEKMETAAKASGYTGVAAVDAKMQNVVDAQVHGTGSGRLAGAEWGFSTASLGIDRHLTALAQPLDWRT